MTGGPISDLPNWSLAGRGLRCRRRPDHHSALIWTADQHPRSVRSSSQSIRRLATGTEGCVLKRLLLCSSGRAMSWEESMAARHVLRSALLVSLTPSLAFHAVPASASTCHNTVVVTDGGDSAGATPGQLRTALVDVCSGGTIRLRPGLVVLLAQGELVIPSGKVVTIKSPRQQPATIDAQGLSRVLSVESTAQLILRSVIVQGGSASFGGGILNLGSLTLAGVTSIRGNHATNGGGIFHEGAVTTLNDSSSVTSNSADNGGGILNAAAPFTPGVLTLNDNARVTGNSAAFGAGIAHESLGRGVTVLNDQSRISNNLGTGVAGARAVLTLNDESEISFNVVGVRLVRADVTLNDRTVVADNQGVGVFVGLGSLTLNDDSRIVRNGGVGAGGALVSITLNGSSRIGDNDGGGVESTLGRVTLNENSTISKNTSSTKGGGVLSDASSVVLNDSSTIVGNVAPLGGGVYNSSFVGPSSLTLNGTSTITGNTATAGQGGGVYSEPGSTVTMNESSSITANIPDNCFPAIC
jgi:hypothetical protein